MFESWLLSNIVDEDTKNVPEHLRLFKVLERSGVRVGIIGLFEEFVFYVECQNGHLISSTRSWQKLVEICHGDCGASINVTLS